MVVMTAHNKGTTSIQITITHFKPVHVCNAVYLCVSTKCLFLFLFRFTCILFSDVVLFRSGTKKQLMRSLSMADKFTLKFVFFPSFAFALPQKKVPQATDRNSRHPHIGRAISWPLYQYPQCLGLFTILLALEPTLPPSAPLCSYWASEL